jgi:hypothetical protein
MWRSLLFACQDCVLSQMGRVALLALGITLLMVAVHGQQDISECLSAKCAWMDERICPGKFFPQEPSAGRCCASCLVIMGKSLSLIAFPPQLTPYVLTTGPSFFLAQIVRHYTDRFPWWQAAQCSPLFKSALRRGPRFLDECIGVIIVFLLTVFKEGTGNGSFWLTYIVTLNNLFVAHRSSAGQIEDSTLSDVLFCLMCSSARIVTVDVPRHMEIE